MSAVPGSQPDSPRPVRGFDPDRNGICGDRMPVLMRGVPTPVCDLRAGHEGWHESSDGGQWSRDEPVPALTVDAGATNTPDPGRGAIEGVQAVRDDLSGSVWRVGRSWGRTVVRQAGEQPSKTDDELLGMMLTPELAQQVCDAVNARRVSVDDDTVERVARAMREGDVHPDSVPFLPPWESLQPIVQARFRDMAGAAVQALRDGSSQ